MVYNPELHNRRNIRLKCYDYSKPGLYFVTICTQKKQKLFGEIVDNKLIESAAGIMLRKWIDETSLKFHDANIYEYIIMPDHFHMIIQINSSGEDEVVDSTNYIASLSEIVSWIKTMTTNEYINNVKTLDWLPFDGKVWQRNYYEHVIRSEIELEEIQKYIRANPERYMKNKC